MVNYTIPDRFLNGFTILSSLNDDGIKDIISSVKELSLGDGPDLLSKKLALKSNLSKVDTVELSSTLYSLYRLIDSENIDEVVPGLIRAFSVKTKIVDPKILEKLDGHVRMFMSSANMIGRTMKALEIRSDFERIYVESRIITDIRMVFNNDVNSDNKEAVITHNLKLMYDDKSSEFKNIYIAIEKPELIKLKEHIERAIAKEESIRKSSGLTFISPNE